MRGTAMTTAVFVITVVLCAAVPAPAADGYATVRIEGTDAALRTEMTEQGVDLVSVDPVTGTVYAVAPKTLLATFTDAGLAWSTVAPPKMPSGYDAYHSYDETVTQLEAWADAFPDTTRLFSIGTTVEGRELWALEIGRNPGTNDPDKPAFVLVGQHHAREILTVEVALAAAEYLLENDGSDPFVTALVSAHEIFVIPTINPDGAEFDSSGNSFKLWRKNRSQNAGWPSFCWGTDLNRNYGEGWGGPGASAFPCMLTYRGTGPFSERETAAFRDFLTARGDVGTLISLHTYSELILYPWSHTADPIADPIDRESFETLATTMAGYNGYTPQTGADLYLSSGDLIDWTWSALGIFGFTFELSPSSPFGGNFYPDQSIIEPTVEVNIPAFLLAIGVAREPRRILSTELWALTAAPSGEGARLEWASLVENDASGWNVYRDDAATALNDAPLAAGGSPYSFVDDGPLDPGTTHDYTVEFVSTRGAAFNQSFTVSYTAPGGGDDDDSTDDDADDDTDNDDDFAYDDGSASGDDDDDSGACGC